MDIDLTTGKADSQKPKYDPEEKMNLNPLHYNTNYMIYTCMWILKCSVTTVTSHPSNESIESPTANNQSW